MKIEVKKIVQDLPLGEYDPAYGDVKLQVWVNPPKSLTDQRMEHLSKSRTLMAEMEAFMKLNQDGGAQSVDEARERIEAVSQEMVVLGRDLTAWMAEIWSQGTEDTQMSVEDLTDFVQACDESDPMLYAWLTERTLQMIRDYRTTKKKV